MESMDSKIFTVFRRMKRFCSNRIKNKKTCKDCKYDILCNLFGESPEYLEIGKIRKEIIKLYR